jgi:hypothetical protein
MLLNGTYVLIALICVLAGMKQRINWLKACYMTAVNLAGYCFLVFLKEYLADTACNAAKANSVSGHFAFYIFHLVTLPYIWRHSLWPLDEEPAGNNSREQPQKPLVSFGLPVLYGAFCGVTTWTLYRTYIYGFHSMGQCLNGAIFGLFMHFSCVILMKKLDSPSAEQIAEARRRRPSIEPISADIPLIIFGLFNFAAYYLSYAYHGSIPLDGWELLLNVLVWARILWGP